jgi:hypothetical protein
MSESLSVEQAVAAMSEEPAETPTEEVAEASEQEQPEAPPEAEDGDEAETPIEAEEEQEPETVIEAPHFWSAEKKAEFAKLTPELQAYVLENDRQAQRTVSQKLEEAATARKAAEAEMEQLKVLTERISTAAERAEEAFADRWSAFTPEAWVQLAKENPSQYTALKAQYDAEQAAVQQARTARDAAAQIERAKWVNEQSERLKTLAPELVDPVKGDANRLAVAEYLKSQGVSEQDIPNVGALEASIAWKAMQYDKSVSALKTRPATERPPVRPAAAPSQSQKTSALAKAEAQFNKSGSLEDALRLMNLKG